MNFREELNSIKEISDDKSSKLDESDAEYILNEILVPYLKYLISVNSVLGKLEIIFAVQTTKKNVLEIIVKSRVDNYTGRLIYRKYFPKKNGAMITVKKIQQIFKKEDFEVEEYHNKPGYISYYEKRFSVFIEI